MQFRSRRFLAYLLILLAMAGLCLSFAQATDPPIAFKKVGYPLMESPHFNPIVINGNFVYVTNTPSSTVDVIDKNTQKVIERIHVGIDPVSLAVRPDGKEVWVSNHVSDSVSVIDTDAKSTTFHAVIATIQDHDENKATTFDEPVGIAFASNEKAYVALSRENQIAVIDVKSRKITSRIAVPAQDPRALFVKNGYLFVMPFEAGNKTQLSGGNKQAKSDDGLITFDAFEHTVKNNNVLSTGYVEDVIKHPKQPDKGLFVINTKTDHIVTVYSGLGTLLYGLTVDALNHVYIAQTDARNDVNGKAGSKKHTLKELENRPYLNRVTKLTINDVNHEDKSEKQFHDFEPLPPQQPDRHSTFATPYAIELFNDEKNYILTTSGSDHVSIVDAVTGGIESRAKTGAGPVGVKVDHVSGHTKAWVYNAYDNSVNLFEITRRSSIDLLATIHLVDPTEPSTKLGRKYFYSANVSSTGTFSCASCHANGHVDQLLWVLDTPIVDGGKQIQPRSTMPIRGLRDTEPFHWDGTQGDPYGGSNATRNDKRNPTNCKRDEPLSCIKHLIKNNLNTTMKNMADKNPNTNLSEKQIDDLAIYNLSVPYPNAPKRSYWDKLSSNAIEGYSLFNLKGDVNPKLPKPNVCGDCHVMPFWTSPSTPGPNGMVAPTWRGAYDRFLVLPQGRQNIIDFPWIEKIAHAGRDEFRIWQLSWSGDTGPRKEFNRVWDMVLEGSTGFSGAFARQLTLNKASVNEATTQDLISALETAAVDEKIVLEGEGRVFLGSQFQNIELQFVPTFKGGRYVSKNLEGIYFTKSELFQLAASDKINITLTGRHGYRSDLYKDPQPALWTLRPIQEQGKQNFPVIGQNKPSMTISGRHFKDDALLFVDGARVQGKIGFQDKEKVVIALDRLPTTGMHFLQVQSPEGRMSNEFIFHVN